MPEFSNRIQAGRELAEVLPEYANRSDVIVLGLPRGGVPVAYEIANALHVDMDVMIVRKLGHPGQEELAIGAIASGGVRVLNENLDVSPDVLQDITQQQLTELKRRETAYRGDRPYPALKGRSVLLVDDGLATGATMRAAVAAVQKQDPEEVVVVVPVAPASTVRVLQFEADDVVCLLIPDVFYGVGQFYEDFSQTTDATVQKLLQQAWPQNPTAARNIYES